ncbi:MAG: energy-coupling factor ABC transporter permease [Alphaproteobacteria bacterium]|jgi:ABC-type Co2+ transport system permease subunit|nr:energy-coupling factor ABC transporter permease [Alphaproteobacteria bacterium]MBU1562781.1 energy-coupling factor ABC transporter permease [Alphaproteobacteria bacterium]MBU2303537.1 energy-coupling factor ABC transporter permease [Alphaproteobacteria bacterium]MBU2367062.1 energy-coupling factor ABC transporter permease [Alphaproteobacteria bacterium]
MHIEPELISPEKMLIAYGTAAAAGAFTVKLSLDAARERGAVSLVARAAVAAIAAFAFFEVLPHYPVGVSEVHFILGSTLLLILGAAPAAIGLALGLLLQGLFFAPFDLPQYAANVTTLLAPLFAIKLVADRIIAPNTPYVDISYGQALALSATYQGGVVLWVAFWALYGQGFGAENLTAVATFGGAYMLVVLLEPLVDLAVLAGAKLARGLGRTGLVTPRLYS